MHECIFGIVNGAAPAKNAALALAGAELHLANGVTLLGRFDGEFVEKRADVVIPALAGRPAVSSDAGVGRL